MLRKIPHPIVGVMLGMAALGNLLQSYSETIRLICGVIATILGILFLLKFILYPKVVAEDMKNPIMASVTGTFSMALMLLSVYAKPYIGGGAVIIWYIAIAMHVALIIYFTGKFMLKLEMPKVFASYFIVYVGIVTASITAPAHEKMGIGSGAFWFGFVALLILLVLVTYRYIKFKEVPEPARPLFCIFAAPTSLCLAGYMQSVATKSMAMVGFMAILSICIYVIVLLQLPMLLKLKFYPSYAAFTFPFVISAIGMKMTMAYLANVGQPLPFLQYVVLVQTIIAAALTIYTLIRYSIVLATSK
jgi:Tellurite resistance protein and related permeases